MKTKVNNAKLTNRVTVVEIFFILTSLTLFIMYLLNLKTVGIKEASLKCKQKQDQLDRKNQEVSRHFSYYAKDKKLTAPETDGADGV